MASFLSILSSIEKIYDSDLDKLTSVGVVDWSWPYIFSGNYNWIKRNGKFDKAFKDDEDVMSYSHTVYESYDYLVNCLMNLKDSEYCLIETDIHALDAWKLFENLDFNYSNLLACRPKYIRKEAICISAKTLLKKKKIDRREMIKKLHYISMVYNNVACWIPVELRQKINVMYLMLCVVRVPASQVINMIGRRFKHDHIQFPRELKNSYNLSVRKLGHDLWEGGTRFSIKAWANYSRTILAIPSYKNEMQIETFSVLRIKDLSNVAIEYEGYFSEKRFMPCKDEDCMYATILDYENGVHLVYFNAKHIVEHKVCVKPYVYPLMDLSAEAKYDCEHHKKYINKCTEFSSKRYIYCGAFGQEFYQTCVPCYMELDSNDYSLNIKCKMIVLFMGELHLVIKEVDNIVPEDVELYYHDNDIYNDYIKYVCNTHDYIDIKSTQKGYLACPFDQ